MRALFDTLKKFFALTLIEFMVSIAVNELNVRISNRIAFQTEFGTSFKNRAMGPDTLIQGKNADLSGGEKQKISLSRALIKTVGVMIFDKPTNALGAGSIAAFLVHLQEIKHDRIMIVISHHASLIAAADRLITLKKR